MCWLLKCCFSARANRQKGEVDEGSFPAGAPCLLQLLPEIRSGSREIARLAWLGSAGLCGALLCCAEPGQAEHVHSSLRGVTPLAAGHPREFKKKKALFPRCTLEMSFFTEQPCLTKTIRAPLESPAGRAGRSLGWCSQSLTPLAHPAAPVARPSDLPSLCSPKAAQRPLGDPHPLPSPVLFFCQNCFSLCERSKGNKHLLLPSEHIQPNMRGIFIVEGSDL